MSTKETAREWIKTDPYAVSDDIKRLGLTEATAKQMELIAEAKSRGDNRWDAITKEAMLSALRDNKSTGGAQ